MSHVHVLLKLFARHTWPRWPFKGLVPPNSGDATQQRPCCQSQSKLVKLNKHVLEARRSEETW